MKKILQLVVTLIGISILCWFTVELQLDSHNYKMEAQLKLHQEVLNGIAGDPWQYRVLSPYLLEPILSWFSAHNSPEAALMVFGTFRLLQNFLILVIAFFLYLRLTGSQIFSLTGVVLLAWSMSHAFWNSDLQFNTYFDLLFYLIFFILYLKRASSLCFVALIAIAALNRETSGLMGLLLIVLSQFDSNLEQTFRKPYAYTGVLSLIIFVSIYIALRNTFPVQTLLGSGAHYPWTWSMVEHNLFRKITYINLFATLSIIPMIALFGVKTWPRMLKIIAIVLVPLWLVVHFIAAVSAETRMFLVPQAIVFIPGFLFVLLKSRVSTSDIKMT